MQDDELTVQGSDQNDGSETTSSGRKWKWVVIVAVLFVLVAGGVVGIWAGGLLEATEVEAEAKESKAQAPPAEINEVVSLDPVVVNLIGTEKMSYARIGVALGIHNVSPGSEIFRKEVMVPKIKDELLSSVGQMTPVDLLRPEAKDQVKARIREFVNGLLEKGSGEVVEVYFTDFIVQ